MASALWSTAAAAAAFASSATAQSGPGSCDASYDCAFSIMSRFGTMVEFDFSGLCLTGGYSFVNSSQAMPKKYDFNICGLAASTCSPYCATCPLSSHSTYSRWSYAPVIQWVNATALPPDCIPEAPACWNHVTGEPTCCSADCETLGIGTPLWYLLNPEDPYSGGVGLTFFGVVPEVGDPYGDGCGVNNATGSKERDINIRLNCDNSLPRDVLAIDLAYEDDVCHYVISARTKNSCGCAPYCATGGLMNCGADGCGGFCSGPDLGGDCPIGQVCQVGGHCCRPDCTGRDCGDDGCGGTCGTCNDDELCSVVQTCSSSSNNNQNIVTPPIVTASDASGLAGTFFGGIASVAFVVVALNYFAGASGQALLRKAGLGALAHGGASGQERVSLIGSGGAGGGGGPGLYAMK